MSDSFHACTSSSEHLYLCWTLYSPKSNVLQKQKIWFAMFPEQLWRGSCHDPVLITCTVFVRHIVRMHQQIQMRKIVTLLTGYKYVCRHFFDSANFSGWQLFYWVAPQGKVTLEVRHFSQSKCQRGAQKKILNNLSSVLLILRSTNWKRSQSDSWTSNKGHT